MRRLRRFILTFLLGYIFSAFLFFSAFQKTDYPDEGINVDELRPITKLSDTNARKTRTRFNFHSTPVASLKNGSFESVNSSSSKMEDNKKERSHLLDFLPRPNNISWPKLSQCANISDYQFGFESVYKELTPGIYLYAAFFDSREHVRSVRIISVIRKEKKRKTALWCVFNSGSNVYTQSFTPVTYYEMCENHNNKFGGWILSCEVPGHFLGQGRQLCSVRVTTSLSESGANSVVLSLLTTTKDPEESLIDFMVCVPPLFGKVREDQVVQFVEFSRILGANYFAFYVYKVNPMVKAVLAHYQSIGIASILDWEVPTKDQNKIWYYGQSVSINDCLYRHMSTAQHLIFIDLDEFLVPHVPDMWTWRDVTQSQGHADTSCGLTFKSAFFDVALRRTWDFTIKNLTALSITSRTKEYSAVRNKVMVKPSRIFEVGIHHVSRPWPDSANYNVIQVPPEIAYIHHYRHCVSNFGMDCYASDVDSTLADKYGDVFFRNFKETLASVRWNSVDHNHEIL